MFFKIGVLKIHEYHRKIPVLESLFNKVAGLNACSFIKKRLHHKYFPVKFAKLLRKPFFTEHLRWLLLLREKISDKETLVKPVSPKDHLVTANFRILKCFRE